MNFNRSKQVRQIFDELKNREALDPIREIETNEHQRIDDLVGDFLGLKQREMNEVRRLLADTINARANKAKS
jgi:hypothetical protein